ncbi:MAG TPA: M6 family metalloprotease domain-containing protein [Solirubrobacterales bacterium]|nr:M6 family metalloprotease domain-containing protein [Solirubrobacterales bacterium]
MFPRVPALDQLATIYRAAAETDDGHRCMVSASPELENTIEKEIEKAQEALESLPFSELQAREPHAYGLNDGLIVPGTEFPLGSPPSVIKEAAAERVPLRGTVRVIVVLVDFDDKQMEASKEHFEELFFSLGTMASGSVRDFYQEATHGLVDIQGEVVGTYRLPQTLATYAHGHSGMGSELPNARTMARDAAKAADADVDFAPYDNDGNGYVDAFVVIHAGKGAEETGSAGDIWSHKWVLDGGAYETDTTKIYGYLTVPENAKTGVCAHELGHLLFGWPDLYDTDYSSSGIGNWCLMAGGSWNGGGDRPAHPSAWCKANQGWVSVANQTGNGSATIPDVKESHNVIRLWSSGGTSQEYFLVENRQKTGFDDHLPQPGLLIWHIDDAIGGNTDENHPKVALMQADGKRDLEHKVNRGDSGDPFPGSADNRTFDADSNPSSNSYAGAKTCVAVRSISDSGPTMTAQLEVTCLKSPKEHKERIKELAKEFSKEFGKERLKERAKELEKIRSDKGWMPDKTLVEGREERWKWFERPLERPGGSQGGDLEARVAALEERLGQAQPFIGRQLRPDLEEGAFAEESDVGEKEQERIEDPFEKRLLDSPATLG